MKIGNPSDKPNNGVNGVGGTRTESATPSKPSGKTKSLDGGVDSSAKVTLSNTASSLLGGADPTFDAKKVESVKQSIDDGSYKVDPEVIADKLISNAKELLVRAPS
jgi:negative regulator of flagellin synthesis FlgM